MQLTYNSAKIAFATALTAALVLATPVGLAKQTGPTKSQKASSKKRAAPSKAVQRPAKPVAKKAKLLAHKTSERVRMTAKDVACLTRNVYYEARGEPYVGKLAIAQVTWNRVESKQWGSSVCNVVYAPSQFSWTTNPTKRWSTPSNDDWKISQRIVQDYMQGLRVKQLDDAEYFHARHLGRPGWTKSLTRVASIGNHVFYE